MTLFLALLGLLPGFAWLFFYLKEDLHPEPKKLIALTFLMGALFGVFAFFAETGINCLFNLSRGAACTAHAETGILRNAPVFILLFAAIEELAKFGGALSAVRKHPAFNEPVDAMIYMAVSALGFATLENVGSLTQPFTSPFFDAPLTVLSVRFAGATALHALASALVGYYWAVGIRRFRSRWPIAKGLILATLLHAFFNYLTMEFGFLVFPAVFLIIVSFFIFTDFDTLRGKAV